MHYVHALHFTSKYMMHSLSLDSLLLKRNDFDPFDKMMTLTPTLSQFKDRIVELAELEDSLLRHIVEQYNTVIAQHEDVKQEHLTQSDTEVDDELRKPNDFAAFDSKTAC